MHLVKQINKQIDKTEMKQMEIQVEEVKRIEDGKHEGVIVAVEYREQPYAYVDVVIEFEGGKKVKTGFPRAITTESKLGKLLLEFGAVMQVGTPLDPNKILEGEECTFMTITNQTARGSFANLVHGSLKRKV